MRPLEIADLHTHTTASDGTLSAIELARMARAADLEIIAITDHDSVCAFEDFAGQPGLEVIPGTELSAWHDGREVHVLGYFLDTRDPKLAEILTSLQQKRRARAYHIIRKLAESDIDIPPSEVFGLAAGSSVSRLHVAEILVDNGHSANLYEAFRDFLGPDGTAFVPKPYFTVASAVEIIHAAGGAAALAHPRDSFTVDDVRLFAEAGLDGIETRYPTHTAQTVRWCTDVADEFDLVCTGGSDFHGRRYADTPIGAARVTRAVVDELFERTGPNGVRRLP